MKILFFLTARYPTHKAYGVTTGETARELRELGNVTKVIAPGNRYSKSEYDVYENEVLPLYTPFSNFVRRFFSNISIVGPVTFVVTSIVITLRAIKVIRHEKPDVLWLRDYWATLLLAKIFPRSKLVLEIHQSPSFAKSIILANLEKKDCVAFITIQESLQRELIKRYPRAKIFMGPMGASKAFFDVGRSKLSTFLQKQEDSLRVCYLGRMQSSGKDNGILQLLEDWRSVPISVASLTLIGFSNIEFDQLTKLNPLINVNLIASIDHLYVPKVLAEFDCGLVPYPEGNYHRTRFPIKIVEYCGSGLNIVANNTLSNREILSEDFAYFYTAGDSSSLLKILKEIRELQSDSKKRAERGFMWAQNYTYSNRIREIYPFLEGYIN
jgi:glycosyltransferase involved in cell wall biosynthesis